MWLDLLGRALRAGARGWGRGLGIGSWGSGLGLGSCFGAGAEGVVAYEMVSFAKLSKIRGAEGVRQIRRRELRPLFFGPII